MYTYQYRINVFRNRRVNGLLFRLLLCPPPIMKALLSITSFSSSFRFGGQNRKTFGGQLFWIKTNQELAGTGGFLALHWSDWCHFPSSEELCSLIICLLLQIGVSGRCEDPLTHIKWLQGDTELEPRLPCLVLGISPSHLPMLDKGSQGIVSGFLYWHRKCLVAHFLCPIVVHTFDKTQKKRQQGGKLGFTLP